MKGKLHFVKMLKDKIPFHYYELKIRDIVFSKKTKKLLGIIDNDTQFCSKMYFILLSFNVVSYCCSVLKTIRTSDFLSISVNDINF